MDTRQLVLIDSDRSAREWRLDEQTRQIGLRGVATARQALRDALARRDQDDESTAA